MKISKSEKIKIMKEVESIIDNEEGFIFISNRRKPFVYNLMMFEVMGHAEVLKRLANNVYRKEIKYICDGDK